MHNSTAGMFPRYRLTLLTKFMGRLINYMATRHLCDDTTFDITKSPQNVPGGVVVFSLATDNLPRDDFRTADVRRFSSFVLSHIYGGEGRAWIEGLGEFHLEAGKVVLICPGVWNLYGGLDSKAYQEDYIMFDGPILRQMQKLGLIETGVYSYSHLRFLHDLNELFHGNTYEMQWRLALKIQEILLELQRRKNDEISNNRIASLLNEVAQFPEHWWTVQEMANYCHLCESQFRRQFIKVAKMRPKNYVEECKLREAARLLTGTELSIDDIYYQLGYQERFHFCRRFKEFWGISPGKYRLAHKM